MLGVHFINDSCASKLTSFLGSLFFHFRFTFTPPQQKRERVEREVRRLRDEISIKKSTVSTVTKGVPVNKIEVRPQEQLPQFSGPRNLINPMLIGLSNEAQSILASNFQTGGAPAFQLPGLPSLPGIGISGVPPDIGISPSGPPPPHLQPPPPQHTPQPPPYTVQPRSAKISKEEAAEAAVKLSQQNNAGGDGAGSRLANGRPPQAISMS